MKQVDLMIVGAGPVGLMCGYLAKHCGLSICIIDKSRAPVEVGRADALNARTLQLLEIVNLFSELYPLGKKCNTSSVWSNGQFISRQSTWWDALEGCHHKHFLMLGQAYIEKLLDEKLKVLNSSVRRSCSVKNIEINSDYCVTTLENNEQIQSRYVIGADGSRSFVREHFNIPFEIIRPQIIWAVIDGVINTTFPKVPEIIVFQADTSDVAWIPREKNIDRFYVRMDSKEFSFEDALKKINRALSPHTLTFDTVTWYSRFSVKESVARHFSFEDKVFLVGDACHIHSVNGGQGLNTGLADAFNLIWKLNFVIKGRANKKLLKTYESERKPVAESVIATSGELVRSTKFSHNNTHAKDYVKIVEKRSGNITGMGIQYGQGGLVGSRVFDFEIISSHLTTRLYSLLDYSKLTLLVFDHKPMQIKLADNINVIEISTKEIESYYYTEDMTYRDKIILVRPDGYIESTISVDQIELLQQKLISKEYV